MNEAPQLLVHRLTPENLAFIFGVSLRTVSAWVADKKISFFRVGRVVRFSPEAVLAFISANTVVERQHRAVRVSDSLVLLQTQRLLSLVVPTHLAALPRFDQPNWQNEENPRAR